MLECPKTLEQAKKYRYNEWAGNPRGYAYRPERCAYEVFPNERGAHHHQCLKKKGYGPSGLYCKQHAKRAA